MKKLFFESGLASGLMAAATCFIALPSQAATFERLHIFGDSLSDTGNVFNLSQFPTSPPYFNGRFSNGPVWVEYLAQGLQVQPTSFFNYAHGGATTGTDNTIFPLLPGLKQQVDLFSIQNPPVFDNDLFIVLAGANDYLPTQSPTFTPFTTPKTSVENITKTIDTLSKKGAKKILVVNLPDLGKLPLTLGSPDSERLSKLTVSHNKALSKSLGKLQKNLSSNVDLYSLDLYSEFNNWLADPAAFGFSNVTTPCLFVGCLNPEQYIFWDQIHPTTKAHELIGEIAYRTLQDDPNVQSVPEPSAGVGVLALGLVGLSVKSISRRKNSLKKGEENSHKAA